jgi:putative hydrolase of the HAD superfamily
MVRLTGLPEDEARALQLRYLNDHGATLGGLLMDYKFDPPTSWPTSMTCRWTDWTRNRACVWRWNGWSRAALCLHQRLDRSRTAGAGALGLTDLFDGLFSIEDADLLPKPAPETFAKMIARFGIDPTRTAFFEDTPRNLKPAKALGMTTVLVGPRALTSTDAYIDFRAAALGPFLATAHLAETTA